MPHLSQKQRTRSEQSGISRMENEGGHPPDHTSKGNPGTDLARYGITSVPITFFDWGGYRYSNARDAIAAAKRGARS